MDPIDPGGQPPEDPAARLRKPDPGAAPAPQASTTHASGSGYGLFRMLEDTLTAPVGLGAVFHDLGQAPAPGFPVMIANFAVYALGFLAVNILRARLTFPEAAGRYAGSQLGVAAGFGVALMIVMSFVWAGLLHIMIQASGGKGDYRRSYQVMSLLSVFWPAAAAANAFPFGWLAVLAFWTYLTVVAVENMTHAPSGQASAVFGLTAAACAAVVWFVSLQVDAFLAPYLAQVRAAAQLSRQLADEQSAQAYRQSLQNFYAPGSAPPAAAPGTAPQPGSAPDSTAQVQQLMLQAQQMMRAAQALQPGAGAQDAPGTQQAPATPQQPLAQLGQSTQQFKQTTMNALDNMLPMLNNPALTKGMKPEDAQRVQEFGTLLGRMQESVKGGKPLSPADIAELQRLQAAQMQQMLQQMQKNGRTPPAQSQPAPQAP